ncbi:hypothetical protein BN000_00618 [Mycobacterium europaeum]|uniref:Uncharacterized protein n=1 Tax=Mycobacterium europaeum TaxID=761804 RepID=A0A0U1CX52_9MYCO|nr:hypothetical protein BN000_00618 [Mycobacterium europaeum]
MFPDCVIPGCPNPVASVGEPCGDCQHAFGIMLRHNPGGHTLTEAEIDDRDSYVHRAYALQRSARR